MSDTLLRTKLFIPAPRAEVVQRPHLIERLNEGVKSGCKLTLISAPAGFGKSTLVSAWLEMIDLPVAWLTLDERDNDPARFLTYLVAALQNVRPGVGINLRAILQSPQPLQIENILTLLVNELTTIEEHFLVVLDDYHSIDSPQVDQALDFLIEHQPGKMHLVITTREDPDLPLARLRARGHCIELRAADLRFSASETAEFLNRVMNLGLAEKDVEALEARTEGWIAGLQMAAISLQSQSDIDSFIRSFTGSHRFVMDYLIEEVFGQQPEKIQSFLQKTAILERMCGPLCDAVLADSSCSSQSTLEHLERANLFIVPQDSERRWYRYHQLFASLLRQRLGQSLTSQGIANLHRLASEWYENNELNLEAFRHAATASDYGRAIRLMESGKMPVQLRGAVTTMLNWLEKLPEDVKHAWPLLWWKQAALLLTIGQTTGVEEMLQLAEAALTAKSAPDVVPDDKSRDLMGRIAATRANLALTCIDMESILVQAHRALEYLHPESLSHRASASCALGFYYYWQDNWTEANRMYNEALSLARTAKDTPNAMLALIRLGQLQKDQNHLLLAIETFQNALRLLDDYADPNAVIAYLNLAEIFCGQNQLDAAERCGEQGYQLARQYEQVIDRVIMSQLHLAAVKLARRDLPGAAHWVRQAEQISRQKNYATRLPNIAYFQVWIYLNQGNLDAAAQLVKQYKMPLMQVTVLLRQDDPAAALAVLEPLRQQAEANDSTGRLLNVMALQSLAHYLQGDNEKALAVLEKALALAEPEGIVRLFLDEGPRMAELLSAAAARGIHPDYAQKLLAAFAVEPGNDQPAVQVTSSPQLAEPLSPRELEVLRLIAEGLSNQEIGKRLFLALDTVKGHNRRIFAKLQIQRRTEAIARARELGLI